MICIAERIEKGDAVWCLTVASIQKEQSLAAWTHQSCKLIVFPLNCAYGPLKWEDSLCRKVS